MKISGIGTTIGMATDSFAPENRRNALGSTLHMQIVKLMKPKDSSASP